MSRLLVAAALLLAIVSAAETRTSRRQCREACGPAIKACKDSGVRARVCRRRLLRHCRRDGLAACTFTATTITTMPAVTTTTIANGPIVNGCDPRFADDHRGDTEVVVDFGKGIDVFDYAPECIAVLPGTAVTFDGDFRVHPLVGGEVVAGTERPEAASPFGRTASGTRRTFVLNDPGIYGYYCDQHSVLLMYGAVVVVAP